MIFSDEISKKFKKKSVWFRASFVSFVNFVFHDLKVLYQICDVSFFCPDCWSGVIALHCTEKPVFHCEITGKMFE
jgi:hypothetical protein